MTSRTTTPCALAERAGVDERTIRRACQSGELRAEQHNRMWVILTEDADEWLKSYVRYARKARQA